MYRYTLDGSMPTVHSSICERIISADAPDVRPWMVLTPESVCNDRQGANTCPAPLCSGEGSGLPRRGSSQRRGLASAL